jgi:hypothetical protein
MQHRLDPVRHESVTYFPRQARCRDHPVCRVRHDRKTLFAQFAGEIAREVGARQIQQRAGFLQSFRFHGCQHQVAQRAGIALARDQLAKAGIAGGRGGVFADRKQRQFQQPAAFEMGRDGA